jgi:1-acyl-sn-glycerol-3-phosphate acyltransferase
MKSLGLLFMNVFQWLGFCFWSLFWMSSAIVYGTLFRNPDRILGWARNYWASGLVWLARATLIRHPGFVPEPGKPYIFAMNHQSLFDIVAAFVCIPVNIRFIAKKSLRGIPFLGWYMRAAGMVFIDRRNRAAAVRSLDEACEKIRDGANILVYPEGTRSEDGRVMPLKKGPFVMAIQAGVPIVPVAINGAQHLLRRDSMVLQPARVDIVLGVPIPTAGLSHDDRAGLMEKVRSSLIDLHLSIGGIGGDRSLRPEDSYSELSSHD